MRVFARLITESETMTDDDLLDHLLALVTIVTSRNGRLPKKVKDGLEKTSRLLEEKILKRMSPAKHPADNKISLKALISNVAILSKVSFVTPAFYLEVSQSRIKILQSMSQQALISST